MTESFLESSLEDNINFVQTNRYKVDPCKTGRILEQGICPVYRDVLFSIDKNIPVDIMNVDTMKSDIFTTV